MYFYLLCKSPESSTTNPYAQPPISHEFRTNFPLFRTNFPLFFAPLGAGARFPSIFRPTRCGSAFLGPFFGVLCGLPLWTRHNFGSKNMSFLTETVKKRRKIRKKSGKSPSPNGLDASTIIYRKSHPFTRPPTEQAEFRVQNRALFGFFLC